MSLFANVGIAETYMHNHKINIVVANELLEKRAAFHQENHPKCKMIQGDITNEKTYKKVLSKAKKHKCQFLIATPPCQGMSLAGMMKEDDPRNSLVKIVVRMIKELNPKHALIENVRGILKTSILVNSKSVKIVDYINSELIPLGYFINSSVVDSADYGTPQTRRRAIFLISKVAKWKLPQKMEKISVKDAIGHLPSLQNGENSSIEFHRAKKHNERHTLALKYTPTGQSALDNKVYFPKKKDGSRVKGFNTTYKRMEWNKPAPTITMSNGSISSQNNVHPGVLLQDGTYSDTRVLSLKEIFILTGLPEKWKPPEWAGEHLIRETIGEGIPPRLIDSLLSTIPRTKDIQ